MVVTRLVLRDFRSYQAAEVALGPGLTVVHGRNGAGKTNLVEALYLACTGRSCRTSNEREAIRFGAKVARVEVDVEGAEGARKLSVALETAGGKHARIDGRPVDRLLDEPDRPLVAVFMPDRLALVKGAPSVRRAHLDQVVAALWPARAETRRAYARALTQRNALLARVRAGLAPSGSLPVWDAELARHGLALMSDRASAIEGLAPDFAASAAELGLGGEVGLAYRPRSRAATSAQLAAELAERTPGDVERGFTGHGPHRDDMAMLHEGRELRTYGSQGQQRLALLSLLLAERGALARLRDAAPLMLLDDVLSELDPDRRARLIALLRDGGQALVTAADPALLPSAREGGVTRLAVADGMVLAGREAEGRQPQCGAVSAAAGVSGVQPDDTRRAA
ncbi:MAG: DNA replication/repair protein RecF [Solirubrobacteraceae bacterium]